VSETVYEVTLDSEPYRGTSLIRKCLLLATYSKTMLRALGECAKTNPIHPLVSETVYEVALNPAL